VVSPKQRTAWVYFSSLFQVVSPKQRTTWVYLSSNGQSQTTDYLCLPVIFLKCHSQYVGSISVSLKLSFQTNTMVHHHFPQWNYTIPKQSRIPFHQQILSISLLFLIPVKMSMSSCIHNRIACIHSILGQKWCTLDLSLFDPSNQRFHLQISRRRNLNRGICHTPIFDPRYHRHLPFNLGQSRPFSVKNSAERYFKIPHIWFRVGPSSFNFLFLFIYLISIFYLKSFFY